MFDGLGAGEILLLHLLMANQVGLRDAQGGIGGPQIGFGGGHRLLQVALVQLEQDLPGLHRLSGIHCPATDPPPDLKGLRGLDPGTHRPR